MNYIRRSLEHVVLQANKEYPIIIVTGPRQVGKTAMLQKLMEGTDRSYVSLDDLNERSMIIMADGRICHSQLHGMASIKERPVAVAHIIILK